GLPTRPAWEPMHRLAPHADCPRAPLPVAERLAEQLVCLPSGMSAAILEGPS
ncbi:MAG: aminotransferase DegT, partial [Alphaproteobacteria bacterium]|nr:aminotransferase DegT [Alphaproteobacteria bacterium]